MNSTRSITLLPFTPRFRPRCARPPAHIARLDSTRHHHDTHALADPARIHCSPTPRARPALTPVEPDPGRLGPLELRVAPSGHSRHFTPPGWVPTSGPLRLPAQSRRRQQCVALTRAPRSPQRSVTTQCPRVGVRTVVHRATGFAHPQWAEGVDHDRELVDKPTRQTHR